MRYVPSISCKLDGDGDSDRLGVDQIAKIVCRDEILNAFFITSLSKSLLFKLLGDKCRLYLGSYDKH